MSGKTALCALLALAFAVAGGGAHAAAAAPQSCNLGKFADLPVTMTAMRPQVTAKINGIDTSFTVDSGAFFSILNRATVDRLGLKTTMAPFGYEVRGAGGSENRVDVAKARFGLGILDVPDVLFLAIPRAGGESAGLLGQNVLSLFDTEYDIGNGMIRLMKPSDGCAHANLGYWADRNSVNEIEVEPISPQQRHLRGTIRINGQKMKVMFDTGASSSILKRSAAERVGFRIDAPDVQARGPVRGIGPRALEVWTAPFDSIDLGGERIEHTRLQVADLDTLGADMLLGIDFFLSHRVYVSKQQHKIFFTYNGGPVFRLEPRAKPQLTGDPTQTLAAHADTPTDAAAFVRRGEASIARRDYASAAADFGEAIKLEPNDAQHYVQRANAHAAAGEAVLAIVDFDQALKLRPSDASALLGRGRLYLIARDAGRGAADLDAAVKADPDMALAVGTIYANNQRFEPAIANFDLWITGHPQAANIAMALAQRCRTRAYWNHDLDKALADCEAAIRKGPLTATLLETRGLAHLRRGETDAALADYDRALKLQPKLAWALMGRGIAKRAKGDAAGGDADIGAATAIQPNLSVAAQRYGLLPGSAGRPAV